MYYKVKKDNKVIDALDRLTFVKYQEKNKIMVLCDESEAQGIIGSDNNTIYHVAGYYAFPISGYETVELEEIDIYEYKKCKYNDNMTADEIIDQFVLELIESGVLV